MIPPGSCRCCPSVMGDDPADPASPWRLQVLEKGQPEGTMPGIAGRQVALQEHDNVISGLLNSRGEKVRTGQCTAGPVSHASCRAGSLLLRKVQ